MEFSNLANSIEENIFSILEDKRREFVNTGKEVINLSVGTPDFPPSEHVVKALLDAASIDKNYGYW